jgi:ribosomal protein S12 methylthiotransferase
MTKRVYISNLGCPKNEVDGGLIAAYLRNSGCSIVTSPETADILIVNTCGFIQAAKEESISEILDLAEVKSQNGHRKLIVSGCLAQRYKEELAAGIPEIDAFLGICDIKNVRKLVSDDDNVSAFTGKLTRRYQHHDVLPLYESRSYAYLRISDGCSNHCAYCAIPQIRGSLRSRRINDVLNEARELLAGGVKELILIGQDTTQYGVDIYGKSRLSDLIGLLSNLGGEFLIRVMYAHPGHMDKSVIEALASNRKVIPYLDLPIQHISDRILDVMNRRIKGSRVRELVTRLREAIPGLTLRTTYIAGHPGETTSDFEKLYKFQEEFGIERVGVISYSPEEGTRSYSMSGHVRPATIACRVDSLMNLVQKQSLVRNHAMIGTVNTMIVDEMMPDGGCIARLLSQAPEIDGCVYLKGKFAMGDLVSGRIVAAEAYDLYAEAA